MKRSYIGEGKAMRSLQLELREANCNLRRVPLVQLPCPSCPRAVHIVLVLLLLWVVIGIDIMIIIVARSQHQPNINSNTKATFGDVMKRTTMIMMMMMMMSM